MSKPNRLLVAVSSLIGIVLLLVILLYDVGSQHEDGSGLSESTRSIPNTKLNEKSWSNVSDKSLALTPQKLAAKTENLTRRYTKYLKEKELARISDVKAHESFDLTSSYSYEVIIQSPTISEIREWAQEKKQLLNGIYGEARKQIELKLSETEADFELRQSSSRRVTFDVPHAKDKEILYSEYFILDLKSGNDRKYPAAAHLPKGVVHNLLKAANVKADPNLPWRYDHIMKLAPEG